MVRGATPKAGGALSKKVALTWRARSSQGPGHHQGQQEEEDPHAPHPGDGDDPALGRGHHSSGLGAEGDGRSPAPTLGEEQDLARPGLTQVEDLADERRGRHQEDDHGLDHGGEVDRDAGRRLHVASARAEGGEQQ